MLKVAAFALAIALAAPAFAQEQKAPAEAQKSAEVKAQPAKSDAPKEVGNKRCPISGAPVGSMQKGSHVDYNGYRVGLCCDGCKKAFMAKADESLKKAQADAAETTGTASNKPLIREKM